MTANAAARPRPIRVLVAKPGLDGHDVGAKIICRALAEAGMEVVYTGLRQSPEMIASAALQENVDVVGLSILSGAHMALVEKVIAMLREKGLGEVAVIVGGNIPRRDHAALKALGVTGVFPTGTEFGDIVAFLEKRGSR